jgi:hypothetical protein
MRACAHVSFILSQLASRFTKGGIFFWFLLSCNLVASIYKVSCYRKGNKSLYIISTLCTFIKLLYLPDCKTTHPYISSVFMTTLRQKMIKLEEKFLPFIRVWYLRLGWYYFLNNTPCQFQLRFIIMIKKYTGTAVLVLWLLVTMLHRVCRARTAVLLCGACWGADWVVVLLSEMQSGCGCLFFPARCVVLLVSWRNVAAVMRRETTELLLLCHYLLLLLWHDCLPLWNE